MASLWFDAALDGIGEATIDWNSDTIKCLLTIGAGTPVKSNATVTAALAEASVDECAATAYVRKTLASCVVTTSGNKTLFDGDSPVWTTLGGASNDTITGALIFKFITDDSASIPICYIDTNNLTTNGGQVTLTKDATNKFCYFDNT